MAIEKELTPEEKLKKEGADAERLRLLQLFLKSKSGMITDYKNTIKHTGGLLTKSMTYAYSKGIEDTFKLLNKGSNDEESVQG